MTSMDPLPKLVKPLLRGHFHQAAFFVSLGACAMLLVETSGFTEVLSIIIYSLSVIALFGISALYHRPRWSPNARTWMKRLDHAAIFIMIAGTGTPLCLLAMPEPFGKNLLIIFWTAATMGIIQSLFWVKAPKIISAILYIVMGWLALPYLPEMSAALGTVSISLIIAGGIIYSVGALIYAFKRPDPVPHIFGYHEIFHLLVIVAAALHFIVIAKLIY